MTASYNGKAPHNASAFVEWLETSKNHTEQGLRYAVLGCGDRSWSGTYQSVPRFIDEQLEIRGGSRLIPRGEADASSDIERQISTWLSQLWPLVLDTLGLQVDEVKPEASHNLQIHFVDEPPTIPFIQTYGAAYGIILSNCELQAANSGRSTRHIEISLPKDVHYTEGDHVGVIPKNRNTTIQRVLTRFGLTGTESIRLSTTAHHLTHLPLDRTINVVEVIQTCIEIQEPATRAQLQELAIHTVCPPHRKELEAMMDDERYSDFILGKRVSMLDLLEQYEACQLPFSRF